MQEQKPQLKPVTLFHSHLSNSDGEPEQEEDAILSEQQVKYYQKFADEMTTKLDFSFENCQPLNFASRTIDKMNDLPHYRNVSAVPCVPIEEGSPYCSPLFMGIGAQKSGTTSLFSWIEAHPQFTSKSYKEIHYFDKLMLPGFEPHKKDYLQDFPRFTAKSHRFTGEITPSYMDTPPTAYHVHNFFPEMKIIVCLRDPTDRAYSQFNYHHNKDDRKQSEVYLHEFHRNSIQEIETIMEALEKRDKRNIETFEDLRFKVFKKLGRSRQGWGDKTEKKSAAYLYPVLKSMFYYQLHDWVALFPPENILIVLIDEIQREPVQVMRRVEEFLQLAPFHDWESVVNEQFGSANSQKKSTPKMLPETRMLLKRFYDPMVACLETMTGKNLTHWRDRAPTFEKLDKPALQQLKKVSIQKANIGSIVEKQPTQPQKPQTQTQKSEQQSTQSKTPTQTPQTQQQVTPKTKQPNTQKKTTPIEM